MRNTSSAMVLGKVTSTFCEALKPLEATLPPPTNAPNTLAVAHSMSMSSTLMYCCDWLTLAALTAVCVKVTASVVPPLSVPMTSQYSLGRSVEKVTPMAAKRSVRNMATLMDGSSCHCDVCKTRPLSYSTMASPCVGSASLALVGCTLVDHSTPLSHISGQSESLRWSSERIHSASSR